jgi:RimJ/RimL family protein N-acetyltransferase
MVFGRTVALRPIEEEDLPLLVRWRNDPGTWPVFYAPFLISLSGQKRWYESLLSDPTRVQFMIVRLEDNIPVGTVGLFHINYRDQDAEAGTLMVDPMLRGHAFAVEAVTMLIRYAFQVLNLRRLYIEILDHNRSAYRTALKIGFRLEATARKAAFSKGEFHNVFHLAVLRGEWQPRG